MITQMTASTIREVDCRIIQFSVSGVGLIDLKARAKATTSSAAQIVSGGAEKNKT